jgi:hypothetical protein
VGTRASRQSESEAGDEISFLLVELALYAVTNAKDEEDLKDITVITIIIPFLLSCLNGSLRMFFM